MIVSGDLDVGLDLDVDEPGHLGADRIVRELPNVPFKDEVWPKFLRENALRVFKLTPP